MDIKIGELSPDLAEKYAYQAVNEFIGAMKEGNILFDRIELLSGLAFHKNKEISDKVLEPMFGVLINELKKSFKKREGDAYLKIFPYFILAAKNQSEIIKNWFEKMEISESNPLEDLYKKSLELRKPKKQLTQDEIKKIKKLIVLSRSTIGAEILASGVLLPQLIEQFKTAEIIFIDSCGAGAQVFNHPRIRLVDKFVNEKGEEISLRWNRKNISILERFEYTATLSEFISLEIDNLGQEEYIILDADTRLSQTGAMPISKENHYFIDTVMEDDDSERVESIAAVCGKHINRLLNTQNAGYPRVYLSERDKKIAQEIWDFFGFDKKNMALVSFTSGIESKTLSPSFEKKFISKLIELGFTPLIERSPDPQEDKKNVEVVNYLRKNGKEVLEIDLSKPLDILDKKIEAEVYTFQSKIGPLAALIEKSNLVVGYDSKNQHIAAAVSTPFITLFTGHINNIFLKRWTPISKNFFRIVEVEKKGDYETEALKNTEACLKEFLSKRS